MHVHRSTQSDTFPSTSKTTTYKCTFEQCSFHAKTIARLQSHVTKHHHPESPLITTFQCSYEACQYHGKSLILLKRHMEIHNAPKRVYSCAKCDFETRHSGHLKRHLKVHDTNEDRYLQCPHCDYRCNIMVGLLRYLYSLIAGYVVFFFI